MDVSIDVSDFDEFEDPTIFVHQKTRVGSGVVSASWIFDLQKTHLPLDSFRSWSCVDRPSFVPSHPGAQFHAYTLRWLARPGTLYTIRHPVNPALPP